MELPMPHHAYKTASGKITHVFGHRFVVKTADGDLLADLTPHGLDQIHLAIGEAVTIEGEMKPTELKVDRLTRAGKSVVIDHDHHHGPHHHHDHRHPPADPAIVVASAKAAGFEVLGTPRRKPKHFEVLGKRGRTYSELHIELDGHIRKAKPVARDDAKWVHDLPGA
jgi:hypothetical protein